MLIDPILVLEVMNFSVIIHTNDLCVCFFLLNEKESFYLDKVNPLLSVKESKRFIQLVYNLADMYRRSAQLCDFNKSSTIKIAECVYFS